MYLKILKMGPTILFTHLKLFYYSIFSFQFSISAKIGSIQTDPINKINLNQALWDLMQNSENVPIQIAKFVQIS